MVSPSDQMQRSSSPVWRAPALCYPSGSFVPWSTAVWQVMAADRYKLICPRIAWHVNSQGLCELEEKSPKRRKKLLLFCLEKPPPESGAVLEGGGCRLRCRHCPPGAGQCHAAAAQLAAPRFTWKHSKLLSFWQLSNCSSTRYCFTLHCFPCQEALLYYSTVV